MASLPAPQTSQRRPNQPQTVSSRPSASPTSTHTRSTDSQTIFAQRHSDQSQAEEQQNARTASSQPTEEEEAAEKKCWICFSDASEDTPDTSAWRDPCPCALVAHEECLLDWIADVEAPKNHRNRSMAAPKIECPQCKAEIKLSRPTNYVVDVARSLERIGARVVTPGAIATLCGVICGSSAAWGAHSIYAVFGAEDGFRILRPIIYNATRAPVEVYAGSPRAATKQLLAVLIDHLVHWRLYVGLPLITPMLIMSRSNFADGLLPVLPIVFFASQAPPHGPIDFAQWPPSASFVFALLPYVRSMYNTYYQRIWADKEKRWLREIQPRAGQSQADGEDNEDGGNDAGGQRRRGDDENVFEVRIDGGIWEEWADEEQIDRQAQQQQQQQQIPNNAPAVQQRAAQGQHDTDDGGLLPRHAHDEPQPDAAAPAPQIPRAPPAQPQQQAAPQPNQPNLQPQPERRLSFSPTAIAETILGALIFPTVAGLTGEALKLVLPAAWTAAPAVATASTSARFGGRAIPRGLLQQKWGRSVVGGCLFVVCKDALMLYVRWKMAQMHRRRRVVDYDRLKDGARRSPSG